MNRRRNKKQRKRYEISSKFLVDYIRLNFIAKAKRIEAIIFLENVLDQKKYRQIISELTMLKGQLNELMKLKRIGVLKLQDGVDMNSIVHRLDLLLKQIVLNHNFLLIKKSYLDKHPNTDFKLRVRNNHTPKNRKGSFGKVVRKIISIISIKRVIFLFVILVCVIGSYKLKNWYDTKDYSALDQVTTWNNSGSELWAIHLQSFSKLQSAKNVKERYKKRDIEIVQLDNERYYLFIFKKSKKEAIREWDGRIREKWPRSGVVPYDKCQNIMYESELYYKCR